MIIVSYDFENDKTRASFSKFLKQYGHRIQYSVFEAKNSRRLLKNALKEVELKYKNKFSNSDSIVIFPLCESCQKKIIRYGSAANTETDILLFK